MVNIRREEINGQTVDFIIVPKSELRPHLVRIGDGRYIIPFRGIANNSTAARTRLDLIYRERTIDMMRAAFPGVQVGEQDNIGGYLDRIKFGMGISDQPQLAYTIVPKTVPNRVVSNDELFGTQDACNRILNLSTAAINTDFKRYQYWFSTRSGLTFEIGEDYLGIAQAGRSSVSETVGTKIHIFGRLACIIPARYHIQRLSIRPKP